MERFTLVLAIVLAYLSPLIPFFFLTGFFIFVDTIYGVKLARKNKDWSSRKFSRFLYKIFAFNVVLISGYALDIHLLGEFARVFTDIDLIVTKAIVTGLFINELSSIDEKQRQLGGKGIYKSSGEVLSKIIGVKKNIDENFKG